MACLATAVAAFITCGVAAYVQERRVRRARLLATLDPLAGLLNRRGWKQAVHKTDAYCDRYGTSAAVIVLDLDEFKTVNDKRGHHAGDQTLRTVAAAIRREGRRSDHAARLGGDEFALLAIQVGEDAARQMLARIEQRLSTQAISITGGVAERTTAGIADAQQQADAGMLAAKALGRRVVCQRKDNTNGR